ncbi:MAG: tetratricopeptide repeat protein [bacterium]
MRLLVLLMILATGAQAAPADPLALGIAQYHAGNYAQALALFLHAVELAPSNPQGWFWLGATYLKLGRAADAVAALRRAVELEPRNGQAYLFLGLSYVQLDRRENARRAFELALQFAPTAEYANAARQWLKALQAERSSPPPAPRTTCPTPPAQAVAQAPPAVQERRARVEITVHDVDLEDAEVTVSGELENVSAAPVRDIRFQATAFGVTGQQIVQRFVRIEDVLEGGDGVAFELRFSTSPPPMWIRLQVLDYAGRAEPADATQFPVPLEIYADLARSRVKLGLSLTPSLPAARHLLCAWIADAGGFPIVVAGARVTLSATTEAGTVTEVRSVAVARDRATAVDLTWPRSTSVTARTELERIDLSH